MTKEKEGGFLLIDKPEGMTSHDVIDELRKVTGIQKIGHAGTLDPFATGLLMVGVGRENTKKLDMFLKEDKEYVGLIQLGVVSSTFDRDGEITACVVEKKPSKEDIESVVKSFVGSIEQVPPIYSAKKVKGRKLYELARKGISVTPKPNIVTVYEITILKYEYPYLEIKVRCSSGTYIRALAHDIGKKLSCGGYLTKLRRIKIGVHDIKGAHKLEEITKDTWKELLI